MSETAEHLRMLEALLFAAEEPLDEASLALRLPDGVDVPSLLREIDNRGSPIKHMRCQKLRFSSESR